MHPPVSRTKILLWSVPVALAIGIALTAANRAATRWIEGGGLQSVLDKETSKGMKFDADYGPLKREGWLGVTVDSFHGTNGKKAIVSLDAEHVTAWFNPLGILLRHWEVHDVHIQSGTVWIQKTEGTPGAPKGPAPIPWWALFWPYRVELEDVICDEAQVLFKLKEKESGLYHTRLEITPNGRDFEYDAKGGVFRTPLTPELSIEHIHLLIRKPRLSCEVFTLCEDPARPDERLEITGQAGLQDDRSIQATAEIKSLPVSPFLPESLRANISGHAEGKLDYHSTGTGMETAEAHGAIEMADAVARNLKVVQEYVKVTGCPDPGDLHFRTFRCDIRYQQGALTLENLVAECPGVLKVTGAVTMAKDGALSGEIQLGLEDPYIRWLPTARSAIFTDTEGDYATTTVHISGTAQKPAQDLSPRVIHELERSPGTALKLFFRAL